MTQPRHSSDHHDPSEGPDADVFHFNEASRERARRPIAPVEDFLLSEDGKAEMEELYETLDRSGNIARTLVFQLGQARQRLESSDDPTIYALFLHDDGAQGLTRPELIKLYDANPLVNAARRAGHAKRNLGDYQAQALYTFGFRVFMNMVRYEWLTDTYDPDDPIWADRTARLGDVHGREFHRNLPPSHNRPTTIPRNTPSDYINHLDD